MSFQILLGTTEWDAVRYVRAQTGDLYTPFVVPDESYQAYAEDVAEDFSRWVPLDVQIGNPVLQTSAFLTVANQQRYVCDVSNGFTSDVARITDVLYRAAGTLNAGTDSAYFALLPFSPLNRFLSTPSMIDSPSERVIRDEYLGELDKYGRGFYGVVSDSASGAPAIDLYPIPTSAGIPVYVRYQTIHAAADGPIGSTVYSRVPESRKRQFARLLLAVVLEQNAQRFAGGTSVQAGILRGQSSPQVLERMIERIRNEVYQQLGAALPSVAHTF